MSPGGIPLRLQSGGLGPQGGNLVGNLPGELLCLGLAAFQLGKALLYGFQLPAVNLQLGGKGSLLAAAVLLFTIQLRQLLSGTAFGIFHGAQPDLMLLFLAFQGQHLLFCLRLLFLGGLQLELHLVHPTLGFPELLLKLGKLCVQLALSLQQLLQLIGPAEDACLPVDGTAGHGTAGVHHLAIQGDNAEPLVVLPAHGDGGVHIPGNHDSAQEIFHNAPVDFLTFHQLGSDGHKAGAILQPGFPEGLGLRIGDGQEGSPSASGTLQVLDGGFAVLHGVRHNLLEGASQGDFNGYRIGILGTNQLGQRGVDMGQGAPLALLHHQADGFLVAFKVRLHGLEHPHLGVQGVQLPFHLSGGLGQLVTALGPGSLPEGIAGDGIAGSGHRVPGFCQLAAAPVQVLLGFLPLPCAGVQILLKLGGSCLIFLGCGFQHPQIRLPGGNLTGELNLLAPQLHKLPGNALGIGGHGTQLLLEIIDTFLVFPQLPADLVNPLPGLVQLGGDTAAAALLPLQILPVPADILLIVPDGLPDDGTLAFQLLPGSFQHTHLHPEVLHLLAFLPQVASHGLCLGVEVVQLLLGLLQHKGGGIVVLLRFLCLGRELLQLVQPHSHFHALQLLPEKQVFLGLFRLLLQRLQLHFQLGDLIVNPHQVVFCMSQFPLRLLFPVAVLGNTCGLLENLPAVAAFQGQNLVDSTLADVGIALLAQAGVHEHLVDVLEPGGLAVDIVLAVSGAVIPAGNHHLVCVIGQGPVGIVQGQGSFRKAYGAALLGSPKNHVLHLGAPEGLTALLSQHPQYGIGDIGFSGAVGAYDGGDVVSETNQGLVREGLEALDFQRF